MTFDFTRDVAYQPEAKRRFHDAGKRQLRALAEALALPRDSYVIRSNKGGVAVSGEVILHHDRLYVLVSQGALQSVLFRTCQNRADYTGGPNQWAPLAMLNQPAGLARIIRERLGV